MNERAWRRMIHEHRRLIDLGLDPELVAVLVDEQALSPDVTPVLIGHSPEGRRAIWYGRLGRNRRDRARRAA